jgi:hypothetical protein
MKKTQIIILFSFLLLNFCLIAQKQETGSVTLELEFSPLGSEPLKISSLRTRYFLSETVALRTSIFAGGKRNTSKSYNIDSSLTFVNTNGNFDFSIRPGIERHFDISSRLSSFIGGEFYYGYNSTRNAVQSANSNNSVMTTNQIGAASSFGLNVLSGTDFYFSDKIYMGIELGFGFLFTGRSISKTKYKNQDESSNLENTVSKGNTTDINWGPNYQGTIRLGYHIR